MVKPGRTGAGLVVARDEMLRKLRARVGMDIVELLVESAGLSD
jgi:hypothetical protein